jgi:hypothetical protein
MRSLRGPGMRTLRLTAYAAGACALVVPILLTARRRTRPEDYRQSPEFRAAVDGFVL